MALSFSPSSWVIFVHFFVMQTVNKSLVTLSDLVVPRRGIPINCSHDSYTLQTHRHTHTHIRHTHTPTTHMHLHTLTHEKLNKVCGSRLNCNKSSEDRRRRRQKERESARERGQERGRGLGEGEHFPHYPDCLPRLRYLHLAHTGSERRQAAQCNT